MVLVSIIIAMKTEHPEKLVMFIPSIPTFSDLNEELSYNAIPRVRRIFCLRQEFVWRLFLNLLFFSLHGNCTSRDYVTSLHLALCISLYDYYLDVCGCMPKRLSLVQQPWPFFNWAAIYGNNC